MLKTGLAGAGHLGKIHLKLLKESCRFELTGFYDSDRENAEAVSREFGCKAFASYDDLLSASEVVDIVTPTPLHFEMAKKAIEKGRHVFIEKPVTDKMEDARELIRLADKHGVKVQVGHVERFNPAYIAAKEYINKPMFIEVHRLAMFNPRGNDVPVVLDLMIHDIDLILNMVKSPVKHISASGVGVVNSTPDIANARIEFENACVANVTASRISMKNMRKTRICQRDAYISIDFLKKETEVLRIQDASENLNDYAMIMETGDGVKKQVYFEKPHAPENNAILEELESFAEAIENDSEPRVSVGQATEALNVALKIIDGIEENLRKINV